MAHSAFECRWWLGGALALLLGALVGLALVGGAQAAEDDGWRVGRLAATQGRVWLLDREDGPGTEATGRERWRDSSTTPLTNWPLGRGDQLRTAPDGRATLQIDTLTLRLGADTELRIEQLDAARVLLWLPRGDLALHVLAEPQGRAIELRTPEGRLWPLRVGHYRASRAHDSTQATAWAGEWRFDADDSALNVPEGRRADFWQQGRPPRTHYAWVGVDRDAFADWTRREARNDVAPAAPLAPELAGMPGAGDLQRWGDWRDDPAAGRVWLPRELPPGWAPYRDGRWVWVSPWGWTWIDAAPWGFAPFHYGQWVLIGGRWAWAPAPRVERHRYVPVLPGWGHVVPRHEPPRPWRRPEPPLRLEPPRLEPPRTEPPRAEPPRAVPPRVQPPRAESPLRPVPPVPAAPVVPAPAPPPPAAAVPAVPAAPSAPGATPKPSAPPAPPPTAQVPRVERPLPDGRLQRDGHSPRDSRRSDEHQVR
ncbi:DUF6600 domain-containing protein [Ideonella sp. DXS22W]|uniref:DUF6600 domain-containing protein n=1 Tax=Pseudaquabacterium inlustre TaxID=2984192 RepID=A0ABU9CJR8_9BURK